MAASSSSKRVRIRPVTPPIGALLANRYRVEDTLGKGGMGVVLAVRDEATGEPLAIKLLGEANDLVGGGQGVVESTEDTVERAARLKREAQAAMRIVSQHVVRVRDVSTGGGNEVGPYIVMERLEGTDLAEEWPLGRKMPPEEVADVALQVCEALSHAHLAGIIHRDIKPSNLFLAMTPEGEEIIKVLDFGISKVTTRAEWERTQGTLTVGDAVLGSPQFVSPEQLRDSRTVDPRTDIWSLGVVMYRLATGAYPFRGETIGQLFTRILERDPEPLSGHGVESPELQTAIDGCLKRDVDERYSNVAELAADLAPLASDRWRPLADAIGARLARQTRARSLSQSPPASASASASSASSIAPSESKSHPPPPPSPTLAWRPVVVVGSVVVALFSAILVWTNRGPGMTTTPSTPASATIAAPSESASSSSSPVSGVEIKMSAEQPIEKVRAPGLRRALLEEGRATLILAEWTGEIEVEAELAGGAKARATIAMTGPREVRLMTVPSSSPKDSPARPPPAKTATARGSASPTSLPTTSSSATSAPRAAPTLSSELHDNPYKKP